MLEKGSELGAHILSGAVMDPRAITELLPDWKERGAPLEHAGDRGPLLPAHREHARICNPHWLLPACFVNDGYYVVSLANVVRWLGQQAEGLGVEVFAGFAAAEVLYDENGRGPRRGHRQHGRRQGRRARPPTSSPAWSCTPSTRCSPKGARGHLGKQVIARYALDAGRDPQT